MDQTSCADYSILRDSLLEIWVPPRGVQTTSDLWTKNLEDLIDQMIKIDGFPYSLSCILPLFKGTLLSNFRKFIFKTNVESYFDIQPPFQLSEARLTGSWSEGLFLYAAGLPDMDFMCILKNITFSKKDQEVGNLLLREDTPFVYAFIANKDTQSMWSEFLDDAKSHTGKYRLSSRKLKEKLQENYQKIGNMFNHDVVEEQLEEVTEGAAVTIRKPEPAWSLFEFWDRGDEIAKTLRMDDLLRLYESEKRSVHPIDTFLRKVVPSSDIVLSILCDGWPSCAREWITRERLWPDRHSVEKIVEGGFHIVPKSSPNGDFRLSFSSAETKLIETLSPLQHKVMRAFKGIVKCHRNTWCKNIEDIISSYHLKTIAFWHFEKTSQASWTEDTLVYHLVTLLQELAEAARLQNLPMYFMPKVNLFQNCDDPEVALYLMEKILRLSNDFSALSRASKKFDIPEYIKNIKFYASQLRTFRSRHSWK